MCRINKIGFFSIVLSVVYATGITTLTGLIPKWGDWYSASAPYRTQTDAFFSGRIAVSQDIRDITFDHVWFQGGVQQVWGLGVPFWRMPFEIIAKLSGAQAFPDRVAFGFFALLTCFVVVYVFCREDFCAQSLWLRFVGLLVTTFLLLSPPFVALVRSRGNVWEEAVAYAYLYGILQVTLLVRFSITPGVSMYILLSIVSGIAGFFRPTLISYSISTYLLSSMLMLKFLRKSDAINSKFLKYAHINTKLKLLIFATVIYLIGGGALWYTNAKRFGNGFEFGHRLNIQPYEEMMYSLKFGSPYEDESLIAATKELFGALFFVTRLNGFNATETKIHPGQAGSVRWREYYFRTYDWSTLVVILLSWLVIFVSVCLKSNLIEPHDAKYSNLFLQTSFRICAVMGIWSLASAVALGFFYLYFPVISSRYMVDFGPSFACAIGAGSFFLLSRIRKPGLRVLVSLALGFWLSVQIYMGYSTDRAPTSLSHDELYLITVPQRNSLFQHLPREQSGYELNQGLTAVPYNCVGWDTTTGQVKPLILFFLEDPQFLEFEVLPANGSKEDVDPTTIGAKIGLEFLRRESITPTEKGWRIRFDAPAQKKWNEGLQCAFVAFVEKESLAEASTPWILANIQWRSSYWERLKD